MSSPGSDRLTLDIADDTFLVADREAVAALVRDPANWRFWWPDLEPTVAEDRGPKGVRWTVAGGAVGSMEIWLEPWNDGVVVHWYLRAITLERRGARDERRARDQRIRRWKQQVHALKDRLEADREPGSPRPGAALEVKERAKPAESQERGPDDLE